MMKRFHKMMLVIGDFSIENVGLNVIEEKEVELMLVDISCIQE